METEITPSELPRIRVVVVDDSRDVRYLLAAVLETDGRFQVVGEAHCAYDGMTLVTETAPELVLVDLQLDGHAAHDGTWLIRQLRSEGSDAVLAVVTGSGDEYERAGALTAGADSAHDKMSMTSTMVEELADSVATRRTRVPA